MAASIMTISAFDSSLARELRGKINAEMQRRVEIITNGVDDVAYKRLVGYHAAMREVLIILDEIEKRMSTPPAPPKAHIRNVG